MPTAITNPLGANGQTATSGAQEVRWLVNASAAAVTPGMVVIASGVNGLAFATTTSAASLLVIGVVGEPTPNGDLSAAASLKSYAIGEVAPIIVNGPARVYVAGLTVAAGAIIQTSTTAGAVDDAAAAIGTGIGVTLEASSAKDANSTIRCWISHS